MNDSPQPTNQEKQSLAPPFRDARVEEIRRLHQEVGDGLVAFRTTLEKAVRLGELLTSIKSELPHGTWLPWLKQKCPFSERSAQYYMVLYERREELKSAAIADLREARKLLTKTLPPEEPDDEDDEGGGEGDNPLTQGDEDEAEPEEESEVIDTARRVTVVTEGETKVVEIEGDRSKVVEQREEVGRDEETVVLETDEEPEQDEDEQLDEQSDENPWGEYVTTFLKDTGITQTHDALERIVAHHLWKFTVHFPHDPDGKPMLPPKSHILDIRRQVSQIFISVLQIRDTFELLNTMLKEEETIPSTDFTLEEEAEEEEATEPEEPEIREPEPAGKPKGKKRKNEIEGTIHQIISDAMAEIEMVKEELQDWLDGMPENLQQSMKAEELQEAIDGLESVIEPEVPEALAETRVRWTTRKVSSRNGRLAEVINMLEAVVEAIREEYNEFKSEVEEMIDNLEGVECPGMY